ncbi:hypothetical protein D3C71_1333710 [compost metagenome]
MGRGDQPGRKHLTPAHAAVVDLCLQPERHVVRRGDQAARRLHRRIGLLQRRPLGLAGDAPEMTDSDHDARRPRRVDARRRGAHAQRRQHLVLDHVAPVAAPATLAQNGGQVIAGVGIDELAVGRVARRRLPRQPPQDLGRPVAGIGDTKRDGVIVHARAVAEQVGQGDPGGDVRRHAGRRRPVGQGRVQIHLAPARHGGQRQGGEALGGRGDVESRVRRHGCARRHVRHAEAGRVNQPALVHHGDGQTGRRLDPLHRPAGKGVHRRAEGRAVLRARLARGADQRHRQQRLHRP